MSYREEIEKKNNELVSRTDEVMADIAHDLKVIKQAVIEIRDGDKADQAENIDIALGHISALIAAVE